MAAVMRRGLVGKRSDYSRLQLFGLCSGSFLLCDELEGPALDQAWIVVGEELTALHRRHFPGTRPWIWFECAAPTPRRRLDGLMLPDVHPCGAWGEPERLPTETGPVEIERQYVYLKRHHLLHRGEQDYYALHPDGDRRCAPGLLYLGGQEIMAWLEATEGNH